MRNPPAALALVAWSAVAACSAPPPATMSPDMGPDLAYVPVDPLVIARPYDQAAPTDYDAAKAYPLVVLLHGYGATAFFIDALTLMGQAVDEKQFVYAYPQATLDEGGYSRWNIEADPKGPDDIAYLDAVIADMKRHYHVDDKRVYVMGHSNGSGMTYRYGCERADRIAGIVPLAGTYSYDPKKCAPAAPLGVLYVQGDADPGFASPDVRKTLEYWAATVDGCGATTDTTGAPLDLDSQRAGAETTVETWSGCKAGTAAAEWVIRGATHHPAFNRAFAPAVLDWLGLHARK